MHKHLTFALWNAYIAGNQFTMMSSVNLVMGVTTVVFATDKGRPIGCLFLRGVTF